MESNQDNKRIFRENVSRVFSAARKSQSLSQTQIAKALGVSQSKLSKIESGQLEPTVSQWLQFCQMANLSSDDGRLGYIDKATTTNLISGAEVGFFRIPEKYSYLKGSKIRISRPILKYFQDHLGKKRLNAFLLHQELDPDFLIILDNQLNVNFNLDLIRHLIQAGELNIDNIIKLASCFSIPDMHGGLGKSYLSANSLFHLIWTIKQNIEKYEINCSYEFEDFKNQYVDLSITPQSHFNEFDYLDSTLGDFLCIYKKHVFEILFERFGGIKNCHIEILEKQKRKNEKTVYRFSI